jgi:uncharacterized protein HemX
VPSTSTETAKSVTTTTVHLPTTYTTTSSATSTVSHTTQGTDLTLVMLGWVAALMAGLGVGMLLRRPRR